LGIRRHLRRRSSTFLNDTGAIFDFTVRSRPLGCDYFDGPLLLNGGFDGDSATAAIERGDAEAVSFATYYIANPDLVERLRQGHPLAVPNPDFICTPAREGYSDYPAQSE
jgi:2,4-dienoyl-CoA reductase-like NADH-dependent reductase (Old Yellow Enzyme family)